jgi:hypothetical protein
MPVLNYESTLSIVVQRFEDGEVSVEEVLEWMNVRGPVVRIESVPLSSWKCTWITSGIGLTDSGSVIREAILKTLRKGLAHGILLG